MEILRQETVKFVLKNAKLVTVLTVVIAYLAKEINF